jgi:hypothetical protein
VRTPAPRPRVPFAARRLALSLLLATLALGLAWHSTSDSTAATAGHTRAAAGSQTFADTSGDATLGGLDLTSVTVTNDEQPKLEFTFPFSALTSLPSDTEVAIYFDTDLNPKTGGGTAGCESAILARSGNSLGFYKCNASSQLTLVTPRPASLAQRFNQGAIVDILKSDLGIGDSFNFWVVTWKLSNGNYAETDRAPASGAWKYSITLTPKLLVVSSFVSPSSPAAGEAFEIDMKVADPATHALIIGGAILCAANVSGKPLTGHAYYDFAQHLYYCYWDVPATSAGQALNASVTVSYQGAAVVKSYTGQIRAATAAGTLKITRIERSTPIAGGNFQAAASAGWVHPNGSKDPLVVGKTTATCSAHIVGGGVATTKLVERFQFGVRCTWAIPSTARGRTIQFDVVIRSQGQFTRKSFRARAR